jgi:hypothetical protein
MTTIREKVEEAIASHRSGEIEIVPVKASGEGSLKASELEEFRKLYLKNAKAGSKGEKCVFYKHVTNARGFEPATEEGWEILEECFVPVGRYWETKDGMYRLKINSQDASFSHNNFQGLASAKVDILRIRRDQNQNDQNRALAGYGKIYDR